MIHRRLNLRPAFPLLLIGIAAFTGAIWGGLIRMGWDWPAGQARLVGLHGPLMVSGFLGTLVSVERAAAARRPWAFLAPLLTALGAAAVLAGLPLEVGQALFVLGSAGLLAVFVWAARIRADFPTLVLGAGTLAWLVGNAFWLAGAAVHHAVFWWVGFLVLLIAGERLELGRLFQPGRATTAAFLAAAGLFLAGIALGSAGAGIGPPLASLGMMGLAGWLLRHDVARRRVRQPGPARFSALALLSAHVWLGVAGGLWVLLGVEPAGLRYDAALHPIFLGFTFAMVMGHAPVILPAVLGVAVPFRRIFYLHLGLLHASLALRVGADLASWTEGRQWGGLLNAVALLLLVGTTAGSVLLGRLRGRSPVGAVVRDTPSPSR